MPVIVREKVEVSDTETEIIEPQYTPHDKDRIFTVSNGEHEIDVKAWGSENGETWTEKATITLPANQTGSLIVGPFLYYVKLTGNTITPGTISMVDACLVY